MTTFMQASQLNSVWVEESMNVLRFPKSGNELRPMSSGYMLSSLWASGLYASLALVIHTVCKGEMLSIERQS